MTSKKSDPGACRPPTPPSATEPIAPGFDPTSPAIARGKLVCPSFSQLVSEKCLAELDAPTTPPVPPKSKMH
jgi:hypothetical protein